jgi:hypothetical protein
VLSFPALHVAVAHRQPSVIEYLLENGADPSAKDVFGVAAIDAAGPAIEPETDRARNPSEVELSLLSA